jgi:outer membrane protein OmpA-like peptidoglycan-associated protein
VAPFGDGKYTRISFYSEYRYDGEKITATGGYRSVTARYALRYRQGDDPQGDPRLVSASGTHVVSIQLAVGIDAVSFMRDTVDETFMLTDGSSIQYKGFILTWFSSPAPLDRGGTAERIADALKKAGTPDVEVTQTAEGVAISLNNIRFIAEQAAVLPEEAPRLKALADALKQIPGRTFHVIGHTARVGTSESQYELSVQRAKAIVDYMVSQGIPAERFIFEGRGGTEPVAPNDTEENMARNRRVEIVILED